MNNINKKNGSVSAATMQEMMKEVHSAPQGIKATINGKQPSKSKKKRLGPPVPADSVRSEADESRVQDPGKDTIIDIDAVTKSAIRQGIVASAENDDSTYFERTDLDTHANMVVLGRNCHVVNYLGKTAEVHPFSPEYEALQVPIVDAVIQYDDPYSGETYMLVCKEALYVPAMKYNLIPPSS